MTAEGVTQVNHMVGAARANNPIRGYSSPARTTQSPRMVVTGYGRSIQRAAAISSTLPPTPNGSSSSESVNGVDTQAGTTWAERRSSRPSNRTRPSRLSMATTSWRPSRLSTVSSALAHATRESFDGERLDGAFEYHRNPGPNTYSLDNRELALRPRTVTSTSRAQRLCVVDMHTSTVGSRPISRSILP